MTAINRDEAASVYRATCVAGWWGDSTCYDTSYSNGITALENCYTYQEGEDPAD